MQTFPNAPETAGLTRRQLLQAAGAGALVLGFTGFVRDWHGVDRVVVEHFNRNF